MTTTIIGNRTGSDFAGSTNSYLDESAPTTVDENGAYYYAGSLSSGNRKHTLLKFLGLSNITGPVTVSSATLNLVTNTVTGSNPVGIYKVLQTSDTSQANWNNRLTGTAWTSNGGVNATDIDTTALATKTLATAFNFEDFTGAALNTLVEGWINGTIANNGFMVARTNDTAYDSAEVKFFGEGSSASFKPILTVVYTAGAPGPTVTTITGTTATEASAVVFTVTMSGTGGLTDAYSWSGTAASADYTTTLTDGMFTTTGGSGSVTVSGGNIVVPSAVTAFTVTVPTTTDTLDEADETIRLVFGGVTASSGTITDDDAQPTVTISDATEVAGTVTFVATLSAASGRSLSFDYATADGTKTTGVDYTAASGTVTFAAGETTKNIVVTAL